MSVAVPSAAAELRTKLRVTSAWTWIGRSCLVGPLLANVWPGGAFAQNESSPATPATPTNPADPSAPATLPTTPPSTRTPARQPREAKDAAPPASDAPITPEAFGEPVPDSRDVRLRPYILKDVKDETSNITRDERDPYYEVLAHCREVKREQLKVEGRKTVDGIWREFRADPANKHVQFSLLSQIFRKPERIRGEPLFLQGYVRKINTIEAGENEFGIKEIHEVWLFTDDYNKSPYVIICLELPPGMPIPSERNPTNHVQVAGYFFKLWRFKANTERGFWEAPLLLSPGLEWIPPEENVVLAQLKQYLPALLGGLFLLVAGGAWIWVKRERRWREQQRLRHLATEEVTFQDVEK